MDLDEAIEHCIENSVKELIGHNVACANDHILLAEWLQELKGLRELKEKK